MDLLPLVDLSLDGPRGSAVDPKPNSVVLTRATEGAPPEVYRNRYTMLLEGVRIVDATALSAGGNVKMSTIELLRSHRELLLHLRHRIDTVVGEIDRAVSTGEGVIGRH